MEDWQFWIICEALALLLKQAIFDDKIDAERCAKLIIELELLGKRVD